MALDEDGPEEHRWVVARDDDGRVRGIGDFKMYRRENLHLAELSVAVLPRRGGAASGAAIVAEAERLARRAGRSELGGDGRSAGAGRLRGRRRAVRPPSRFRAGPAHGPPGITGPAASRGSACAGRRSKIAPRRLFPDHLRRSLARRLLEDRCELGRRMSTDVPMGDQELDEEVWDEARVRQIEASFAAQNRAKVTTAAGHDCDRPRRGLHRDRRPAGRARVVVATRHAGHAGAPRARPGVRHEGGATWPP